jgi:hypothetical protein
VNDPRALQKMGPQVSPDIAVAADAVAEQDVVRPVAFDLEVQARPVYSLNCACFSTAHVAPLRPSRRQETRPA